MSNETTEEVTPKSRGGFASALLGDASSRRQRAEDKLELKFRAKQLKREDNESERDFKSRKRSARLTSLQHSAINVARTAIIVGPIMAPMAVAWTGQAAFAMEYLQWTLPAGVLFAAAYELTTAFCAWMYHEARKDGDKGTVYRLATWLFGLGAAAQQWWHYLEPNTSFTDPTPRSVTFASMTIIGVALWELFARLVHRRKLRLDGKLPAVRPRFGLLRWLRFPKLTFTAWSLTISDPEMDTVAKAWSAAERQRSAIARRRSAQQLTGSGGGRRWFRRPKPDLADLAAQIGSGSTPEPPEIRVDREQIEPPKQEIEQPKAEEPKAIEPPKPSNANANGEGEGDEFAPTELERKAVALLVRDGRSINRANCADAVRELEGGIATKRAAQLAAWGRQNVPGSKMKAV